MTYKLRSIQRELEVLHPESLAAFNALPAMTGHITEMTRRLVFKKLPRDQFTEREDWAQAAAAKAMDLMFTYGNQDIEDNKNADKKHLTAEEAAAIASIHMVRRARDDRSARLQKLSNWNAGEDSELDRAIEMRMRRSSDVSEWIDDEFPELHDWDKANYRDPMASGDIAKEIGRAALSRLRGANPKLYDVIVWSTYVGDLAWSARTDAQFKRPEALSLAVLMGRHAEGQGRLGGPKLARIQADIDLAFSSLRTMAQKILADLIRELGKVPSVWTEQAKAIADREAYRSRSDGLMPMFGPMPLPEGPVIGKLQRGDRFDDEETREAYKPGEYRSPKIEEFLANAAPSSPAVTRAHDQIKGVSVGMPVGITHGGIGDSKGATAKKPEVRKSFEIRPENEFDGHDQSDELVEDLPEPVIEDGEEIRTVVFEYELTSLLSEAEMNARMRNIFG